MVITVGYNIYNGDIKLFNSITNDHRYLKVEPVNYNDVHLIEKSLKEIQVKINGIIDHFCVYMYYHYKNSFRVKFIEYVKFQSIAKNVRIIGRNQALLYGAIENLSFLPEFGDSLWIFFFYKNEIHGRSWNYIFEKKWKFEHGWGIERTVKGNESPTINDLQTLKNKMKENSRPPYVYVYHECEKNETDFKNVFFKFNKIVFVKEFDTCGWMLNYARYLTGDKEYLKYNSDTILTRSLKIKTNYQQFFALDPSLTLPFTKSLDVVCNKKNVITIYENEVETEAIALEKGKFSIKLDIVLNGIYFLEVNEKAKASETLKEGRNKYYFIPKNLSEYKSKLNAVGIDLGTTECCSAVIRKNGPDFIVLDQTTGFRTMPSYIAFDEAEPKCGHIVVDRMRHKFEYSIFDSKRILGKEIERISIDPLWPFKVVQTGQNVSIEVETFNGKDTKTLEEISAVLLSHIKRTLEIYQNQKLTDVVITIPSKFSDRQKQATKLAAEYAGWETIHFLPEPVAAAFAYFTEIQIPNQSKILICDCGGGTIDICVAKVNTNQLEILAYDGDAFLGGRDFDKMLFTHFSAILKHKYGYDVMKSNKKYVLKQKCQDIKHKLSVANEDWLDVDDFDPNTSEIIKITKEEFEEMSSNFMVKMEDVILRSVTKSGISRNSINYVFQVGGGCRMPMIKELLKHIFPNADHQCSLYPDWVVASGAALYSYHLRSGISNESNFDRKNKPSESPKNAEKNVSLIRKMFKKS